MSRGAKARQVRRVRRATERRAEARLRTGLELAQDDAVTAAASGSTDFPLSDRGRAWDAAAANRRWQDACGIGGDSPDWSRFHTGFFWYDSGNADLVTSHKLPFVDVVDGKPTAVWRGVTAGAARLSGTKIPPGDRSGVQSRMSSYYAKAAKAYDDPSISPPWRDTAAAADVVTLAVDPDALAAAMSGQCADCGHAALAHGGSDHMGACSAKDCACNGFAVNDNDADDTAAVVLATFVAKGGKCADCGHMALAHGGDSNMGACSMKGCDCSGFAVNDNDADDAAAVDGLVVYNNGALTFGASGGTSNVSVTLVGFDLTPGTSGTYAVTTTANENAAVFDFSDEFGPHGKGTGGRKGWKNIKIPAARPIKVVNGPRVTPNAADDTDTFDATVPSLPPDHTPGATLPTRNPSPSAPASTLPPPGAGLTWTAVLAPEGRATDDGRVFAPGSITWRELPLTLMGMVKTADGHDGAEVCGRIEKIWRDGDLIRAAGVFDTGEYGQKIATLVNDGTMRGISVDIAPQKVDMAYRSEVVDEDGNWLDTAPAESSDDGPSPLDLLFGGDGSDDPVIYVVRKAVLGMATVCPFQAFADATIEPSASLVASGSEAVWTVTMQSAMTVVAAAAASSGVIVVAPTDDGELAPVTPVAVITASAAGLAVESPPLGWFDPPALPGLTPLTVDDDGRIYGHAAAWGTCHIGLPDGCTTAPHSMTNYSYFHLKEVVCDDGARVSCGTVTMDTGHAPHSLGRAAAAAHYDDTGAAVADVVCGEDGYGIWVAGAVRPTADADAVRKLRGAALSGDWRNVNGNLELVGLLAVNVPGFPIPRVRAELTASAHGLEVTALVAAGAHLGLDGLSTEQRAQWDALRVLAVDEWGRLQQLALRS